MNIFKVMSDPRGYIRSLPKAKIGRLPIYLAWVIGMLYLMRQSASYNLSLEYSFGMILVAAAILAIPFGYIIMYLFTFFVYWAGKLFKGKASYSELFSAAGYGRVPEIFVVITWLILALILGQATFTQIYVMQGLPTIISALLYIQIVFYIWGFVITLHTIGEVQGFSAWMSLWNCILAGALLILISLAIELIVAVVFSIQVSGAEPVQAALNFLT